MSVNHQSNLPDTLTGLLASHSEVESSRVAYRYKQLGIWQETRWSDLLDQVTRLAAGLKNHGFSQEDTLVILSHPRPQTVVLSLAAQWLGGKAAPIDPQLDDEDLHAILNYLSPQFVFAEDLQQVDRVQATSSPALLVYADKRGISNQTGNSTELLAIEALLASDGVIKQSRPSQTAFSFFRVNAQKQIEESFLTHEEVIKAGLHVVKTESLSRKDEAFASRTFANSGHARYLIGPWLVAGLHLNFPENLATRDVDRREIGPTLVAGTKETYERLARIVQGRLPVTGVKHRLVSWALSADKNALDRWLKNLLIRRSLKDVIGFSRTRTPLLVGEDISAESKAFFTRLNIEVRHWPEESDWQAIAKEKRTSFSQSAPRPANNNGLSYGAGPL